MSQRWMSFHGSPGSPSDFAQLENALGGVWFHQDRNKGIMGSDSMDGAHCVGYSWGCRELLRTVAETKASPRSIILISPYMFGAESSFFKRILFRIPILSSLLVSSKTGQIADSFIVESSKPDRPSEIYKTQHSFFRKIKVLEAAVLEKDNFSVSQLPQLNIPILIVYGTKDQTSGFEQQVAPLMKKWGGLVNLIKYEGRGHALPWNQPKELQISIQKFLK